MKLVLCLQKFVFFRKAQESMVDSNLVTANYSKLPPHRTCVFSSAAKPRRLSLKRNLRFSGTGFFFLKGFTVVFHRKKLFRFCFNYVFFLKEFTLFFPHKKSFFVFFFLKEFTYFSTKKKFSFSSLKSYGLSLFTVVLLHQEILLKKKMFFFIQIFIVPKT